MSDIFDEQALRRDIVAKWGPAGAHVDVLDTMVRRIAALEAEVAKARADAHKEMIGRLHNWADCLQANGHARAHIEHVIDALDRLSIAMEVRDDRP